MYKNRILVFGLCAMLFMFCAVGVSATLDIIVDKIALNDDGNFPIGNIIVFQINITNSGTANITEINLTDTYNNTCINYSNSNPLNSSGVPGQMNWTGSAFFSSPLVSGDSALINVNFTAIKECTTDNNITVIATNGSANSNIKQDGYQITIGGNGGGGDTWNQGLSSESSSIVSPYLIKDEAKLLNFSIYREAGDQSCLKNLTIIYPSPNCTFHGYNSSNIHSSNYTTYTESNKIIWNATGDDFFCGSGPNYFIINVTSNASYGSGIFTVSAYANDSTSSEINLTFFTTTTFSYNGTVYDINGVALEGAVASITVISFGDRGDLTVGTFSNTTDANGVFNITDIPGLNVSLEDDGGPGGPGGEGYLFYRLSAVQYNDTPTNHYAMYTGPSLPEISEGELRSDWGLKNPKIYLKPAVTFYIRIYGRDYKSGPEYGYMCNETDGCPDEAFNLTYLGFSYGLKDKKMGFPVSSDHSSRSTTERYFAAPLDRNYSLMVFAESSFPIYVDFTNIQENCTAGGHNISTTGVNATCTITNGTYFVNATITAGQNITPLTGYINQTGSFDDLWIVPYMLGAGEMLFDQDTLPFNIGQLMRWPTNNTDYDDSYNKTTAEYSVYLPATQAHSDIMLMAFARKGSNYYHDLYKLSLEGKVFLNGSEYNFSLKPLISGTSKTITSNNISADWNQSTVVNTTAVQFRLVNGTGTLLSTESSFIEMKLETNNIEYMRMVNAQNGVFTLPVISGEGIKKLTIFSQSYAPVSTPISANVLSGTANTSTINCSNGICDITLARFDLFDPDNPDEAMDMWMDFYKSNSTCDVPNPPTGCNMMGEGDGGMNKTDFSPLKAILMGDVSLRITSGNLSVHYVKTDLLASGPPDAAFSQNSTGSDLNAAWKFGSKGPEIYDEVLISMPYSTSLENEIITVNIPLLYDNEFNVIWNSSVNTSSQLTGTDYADYLGGSYEAYLNGTGVDCSTTDSTLSTALCYKNTANKTIWMKIPHFSGVGTELSNGTTPEDGGITSGGGGGGTPTVTYDEQTVGTLAAGSTKAITFTKSATLAVTEITVTVKNKVTNAKIRINVGSLPSGASVPSSANGSVYKYITITKTAMTDNDVSKGIIKFKVKKEWLTDKGYGKDTVVLHRYYGGKWNKLETIRESGDTTYYYYSAESPGFSTFAITAEKAPVTAPEEEPEEEPEEAEVTEEEALEEEGELEEELEEEKEAKSNVILIVALIAVIIILVIVGYFVQQKKQKKKKH